MRTQSQKYRFWTRQFAKLIVVAIVSIVIWLFAAAIGWHRLFLGWKAQLILIWLPLVGSALFLMSDAVGRTAKFRFVGVVLGVVIGGMIGEALARIYFRSNPAFERMRVAMASPDIPIDYFYRSIGQPYLLYSPAPHLRVGKNYHNEQGFRGKSVPYARSPNSVRVICLGGSTTYGVGVENPEHAYPAQLEALLKEFRPQHIRHVEVINAGIVDGTSAELLTHYHFKYQYLQPDLVILNTGGNDAITAERSIYYQPDYSHERCQPIRPTPLTPECRSLLKSRLFSFGLVSLLYGSSHGSTSHIDHERIYRHLPPPIVWHPAARVPGQIKTLPDSELGFTRNLRRLIDMITNDGSDVLLVPFRIAPGGEDQEAFEQCKRNERIMKEIASKHGLMLAPFPVSAVSNSNWVDSCHVNEAGCREKAEHIASYARIVLWPE